MDSNFENQLCLGSGISFLLLVFFVSLPNGFILMVMVKNPLRCFKRVFSVYLAFISAIDLFVGLVVCPAQVLVRFLCVFSDRSIPQEGEIVQILSYIGINSSILLVTAMSIDRFVAVIFPHAYRQRMKPKTAAVSNSCIIVFSSIFASLQLTNISKDVYIAIDIHLHTTFPLSTTSVAYLGIFYFLKKQSRVAVQRQATMPSNTSLTDRKRERTAKMEKNFATTSFLILMFLILSLIPYFAVMVVGIHCESCVRKNWFFIVRESSTVILFLNSVVNPFLASFRINEMKNSCVIVLGLKRQDDETASARFSSVTAPMQCRTGESTKTDLVWNDTYSLGCMSGGLYSYSWEGGNLFKLGK